MTLDNRNFGMGGICLEREAGKWGASLSLLSLPPWMTPDVFSGISLSLIYHSLNENALTFCTHFCVVGNKIVKGPRVSVTVPYL